MFVRVPNESFESLVSRVNGTGFFLPDYEKLSRKSSARPKKTPLQKLSKQISDLSRDKRELLAALLTNNAVALNIDGASYVLCVVSDGYKISSFETGDSYTVTSASCTCPDAKFRGSDCKHQKALRAHLETVTR